MRSEDSENFSGYPLGASRGRLCDSSAVLLLIITRWGESGKVILQVSIAVFLGTVETIFRQRWLSPPRKKLARMPISVSLIVRCIVEGN